MSDIYICTIDKNDECDWHEIDEDRLDLSSYDCRKREETLNALIAELEKIDSGENAMFSLARIKKICLDIIDDGVPENIILADFMKGVK